jgi:hypothetical protein
MSNAYKNQNYSQKKQNNYYGKKTDDYVIFNNKININDELKKELSKNDIQIDKWYHKLLTGQYFKEGGVFFFDDGILKRLATEYQKALHNRNMDTMLLIRNELFNHIPEQLWIHMYLTGKVLDPSGKQLNKSNPELEALSVEYSNVYNRARQVNI